MIVDIKNLPPRFTITLAKEFEVTQPYISMIYHGKIRQPRRPKTIQKIKAIQERIIEMSEIYMMQVKKANIYIAPKESESLVLDNSSLVSNDVNF